MRVMGIDCGGEYTGFGVVEQVDSGDLVCVEVGAIRLSPQQKLEKRLDQIFSRLKIHANFTSDRAVHLRE